MERHEGVRALRGYSNRRQKLTLRLLQRRPWCTIRWCLEALIEKENEREAGRNCVARSAADSGQISEASSRQRNRRGVSVSRTRRSAVAAATMEGTPLDADRGARAYRLSTPGPAAIDSARGRVRPSRAPSHGVRAPKTGRGRRPSCPGRVSCWKIHRARTWAGSARQNRTAIDGDSGRSVGVGENR